jgi:type I restriction enzyme M protein
MKTNNRKLTSPQSLNSYPSTMLRTGIKSICDIMRRSGRAGALQYAPELTWMLFGEFWMRMRMERGY